MPTCLHLNGWRTTRPVELLVGPYSRVVVGKTRHNRILLRCNQGCSAVRFGTFMKDGAFVRLGRIRQAKPGEI